MTAQELYEILDKAGVKYEVTKVYDDARVLLFTIDKPAEEDEE